MGRGWLLGIILLLLVSSAFGQTGEVYHLNLLAVQETDDGYVGSDAELYLELREGSGRVFLDTFPLTKLDTQISTRYAKQIACDHFQLDCNKYDFIYTIQSTSSIIGGPSAGAALSALTAIAVLDLEYDSEAAVTGTINSGGVVGSVGGVPEKLQAAANGGIGLVIIPNGPALSHEQNAVLNFTAEELLIYGRDNLSLNVHSVSTIDEVVYHLTGEVINEEVPELTQSEEYGEIMRGLKTVLCERSYKILEEVEQTGSLNSTQKERIVGQLEVAHNASSIGDYYSGASYCFSTNIDLRQEYYSQKKLTSAQAHSMMDLLARKATRLLQKVNEEPIETISDLQTSMVVRERLDDVLVQVAKFSELNKSKEEDSVRYVGYVEERLFSAISWMQFFEMDGQKFEVDTQILESTCQQKILEAEERYQYALFFLGEDYVGGIKEKIARAREKLNEKDYLLCLMQATQGKADANAIASSLGVTNVSVQVLIDSKIEASERVISRNSVKGVFPILGYSYYQYAKSLREENPYTTLVYLEYALEMSDLGVYFEQESGPVINGKFRFKEEWLFLAEGFLLGVLLTLVVVRLRRKPPKMVYLRED